MTKVFCGFLLTATCLTISACGPLIPLPGEAPKRYTLSYLPSEERQPMVAKQMMINVPGASLSLDTQRVAVVPIVQQINYYSDMEWVDRLPLVIQEAITYSLQNQHVFKAVTRSNDGVIPDQALKIDIRKFYIDQTAAPVAQAEYFVQLIDAMTRSEVASKTFTASIKLTNPTADTVSESLDQANLTLMRDIQTWLIHHE